MQRSFWKPFTLKTVLECYAPFNPGIGYNYLTAQENKRTAGFAFLVPTKNNFQLTNCGLNANYFQRLSKNLVQFYWFHNANCYAFS